MADETQTLVNDNELTIEEVQEVKKELEDTILAIKDELKKDEVKAEMKVEKGGGEKNNTLINLVIIAIVLAVLFYMLNAYFASKEQTEN